MKQICQILYLDEYKMYSLYSQMFEGLTEYIVAYQEKGKAEGEQQKGPIASGRFLADFADDRSGQHERRFLHDYAYTQFEEKLTTEKRLVEYNGSTSHQPGIPIKPGSFMKVKGQADFNDIKAICEMTTRFNQLGEAILYVKTHGERVAAQKLVAEKLDGEKDRNARAKMKAELENLTDLKKLTIESGLHQNEKHLKSLEYLLEYGYAGHFELQIRPDGRDSKGLFFSALLKRECLREDPALLVKKYSRRAQGCFCMLGVVCQCPDAGESAPEKSELTTPTDMREGLHGMVSALSGVEQTFFGRLKNEVIIDPVVVYREV